MYPDTTGSGKEGERDKARMEDGRGGRRWEVGGWGDKKNHYTARGWKNCQEEFHYFSSSMEKVNCAYYNPPHHHHHHHHQPLLPHHHKLLNNLGTFQNRSFPFLSAHYPEFRAEVLNHLCWRKRLHIKKHTTSYSSSFLSSPSLSIHHPSPLHLFLPLPLSTTVFFLFPYSSFSLLNYSCVWWLEQNCLFIYVLGIILLQLFAVPSWSINSSG